MPKYRGRKAPPAECGAASRPRLASSLPGLPAAPPLSRRPRASARTGAAAGGQRRAAPEKRPPWQGLGLKAGSLGAARIARRPSAPGSRAGPLPGQGSATLF
ncbi:hypothetical protein ADJ79_06135 [Ottowia sp. oral taxon 894]|nr:hypothetical protein ADJ79_06135 [Ottowia sp. oral taxon 894]